MSSSSSGPAGDPARTCSLHLKSAMGPVEIRLFDHNLRPVYSKRGELREKVPEGIYRLSIRAGNAVREQILLLEGGTAYEDLQLKAPFRSVVPLGGAINYHPVQEKNLIALCISKDPAPSDMGRILLFLRNVDQPWDHPLNFTSLSLLTPEGDVISPDPKTWFVDSIHGCAGFSLVVKPGCYLLRQRGTPRKGPKPRDLNPFDQALWVCPGWSTIIIVPAQKGWDMPRCAGATVLMTRTEQEQYLHEPDMQEATLALEMTIDSLSNGRPGVPDLLHLLLRSKFENPMLGIVGAHALLLDSKPDKRLIGEVLDNLGRLIPGHPDLLALGTLAGRAPENLSTESPPMLRMSYQALLAADALHSGVFPPNSLAERIGPHLVGRGIWTSWRSVAESSVLLGHSLAGSSIELRLNPDVTRLLNLMADSGEPRVRTWNFLSRYTREYPLFRPNDPIDPALLLSGVARLSVYLLESFADPGREKFSDSVQQLRLRDLARLLGLPSRVTLFAISKLKSLMVSLLLNKLPEQTSPELFDSLQFDGDHTTDDPQKGRWGGQAVRGTRFLKAEVTTSTDDENWFKVHMKVASSNPGEPLTGTVRFHLHPTFADSIPMVEVYKGEAILDCMAWGAFTVGAEADKGRTRLELDLAELQSAPEAFRKR